MIASHAPFVAVANARRGAILVLLADEPGRDPGRWSAALRAAGAGDVEVGLIAATAPPRATDLRGAAAVYVAGGWTPGYQEAFAAAPEWTAELRKREMPFAGFSAGAAIAARRALVGGHVAVRDGRSLRVCDENAGEGLEELAIRPGLGLTDATIDVHCAQWGTLPRLVNAVGVHALRGGWGIDEHTTLEIHGGEARVHGLGAVYRVAPGAGRGGLGVEVLLAGDRRPAGFGAATA